VGNSQAGVVAAQQVVSRHLPSLTGERCSACGDVFPCEFRRVADRTLNAFGLLPRRVPGAALLAAGVRPYNQRVAPVGRKRRDLDWANADRNLRRRGWFEAVVNPAVGRAKVPGQQ
jgi:hypothetical protein